VCTIRARLPRFALVSFMIPKQPMMTRKQTNYRTSLGLVLSSSLLLAACGHGEDEWQAQLDKYNKLAAKYQTTEDELAKEKARADKLEQELKELGYQLSETGAEKEKLKGALDDYKQRAAALERIKARFELLRKKLEELTKLGLKIQIRNNRMVVSLPGDVLFASGRAELEDKGKEILGKVAAVIRSDSDLSRRTYQVAGHTDNDKIQSAYALKEFKDNWGLSLMRARTVLLYLVSPVDDEKKPGGGLSPALWSPSGYGETDPVAGNDDAAGREKNRRVELIMMPNVEEMLDLKSLASEPAEEKPAAKPAAKPEAKTPPKPEAKPDAKAPPKPAPAAETKPTPAPPKK
jgi:chemotaxis protein MotB